MENPILWMSLLVLGGVVWFLYIVLRRLSHAIALLESIERRSRLHAPEAEKTAFDDSKTYILMDSHKQQLKKKMSELAQMFSSGQIPPNEMCYDGKKWVRVDSILA